MHPLRCILLTYLLLTYLLTTSLFLFLWNILWNSRLLHLNNSKHWQHSASQSCYAARLFEQTTPFIRPDSWTQNSHDLNLGYYKIRRVVQQAVYLSQVHNVDKLQQGLRNVWHGIDYRLLQHHWQFSWWMRVTESSFIIRTGKLWTLQQLMKQC